MAMACALPLESRSLQNVIQLVRSLLHDQASLDEDDHRATAIADTAIAAAADVYEGGFRTLDVVEHSVRLLLQEVGAEEEQQRLRREAENQMKDRVAEHLKEVMPKAKQKDIDTYSSTFINNGFTSKLTLSLLTNPEEHVKKIHAQIWGIRAKQLQQDALRTLTELTMDIREEDEEQIKVWLNAVSLKACNAFHADQIGNLCEWLDGLGCDDMANLKLVEESDLRKQLELIHPPLLSGQKLLVLTAFQQVKNEGKQRTSIAEKYSIDLGSLTTSSGFSCLLNATNSLNKRQVKFKCHTDRIRMQRERDHLQTLASGMDFIVHLEDTLIMSILELQDTPLRHVLVLECGSGSLEDWMKDIKYAMTPHQKVDVLQQLLSALQFMHSHNLVHADVKPANFVIFSSRRWKLVDFDSATKKEELLCGPCTIEYAPPERARAIMDDPPQDLYAHGSYDVWSVGIIGYQMHALQLPYRGSVEEVRSQLSDVQLQLPPLDALPKEVAKMVAYALVVQAEQRQTVGQLLDRGCFKVGSSISVSMLYNQTKLMGDRISDQQHGLEQQMEDVTSKLDKQQEIARSNMNLAKEIKTNLKDQGQLLNSSMAVEHT